MSKADSATLTTIECSLSGGAYSLFESGPRLTLHLAGPGTHGGTGACLCGFDRHARDESGRSIVGFSVGGGTYGPGILHDVCAECAQLADGRTIRGTNSKLFDESASAPSVGEEG